MKILVIGGGGREHAICWGLKKSARVTDLICAPGNDGIAQIARCVDIGAEDIAGLLKFARDESIELTIVGPEAPLVAGIVDEFEKAGLRIFGPSAKAAQLEGSKAFAKKLMRTHAIPTAPFSVFDNISNAVHYLDQDIFPIVVKADGLAGGKGVTICPDVETAETAIRDLLETREFGKGSKGGTAIVIEECLKGPEASILALTDGKTIAPLEPVQDHKPVFNNNEGPNTGGMGAYSPAPIVTEKVMERIEQRVLIPTIHACQREEHPFKGVLFSGLMITQTGPKVLEYNVRFGDPETQPLMVRLKSDLLDLLEATIDGTLDEQTIEWDPRAAVCVVMTSGGYPGEYEKGKVIKGLAEAEAMEDVFIFHAGTKKQGDDFVTAGGRVLGVTALGDTIKDAQQRAYSAIDRIYWDGEHHRTDIADQAISS